MNVFFISFIFELKQGLRDYPRILGGILLGMVVLALLVFGMAAQYSSDLSALRSPLVIVAEENDFVARQLISNVFSDKFVQKVVKVEYAGSAAQAERMVATGVAEGAVILPEGFASALSKGQLQPLQLIISARLPIKGEIFRGMLASFGDAVAAVLFVPQDAAELARQQGKGTALPPSWVRENQLKGIRTLAVIGQRLYVKKIEEGINSINLGEYYAVMMLVTLALFIASSQGRRLLREAEEGVLLRIRLSPSQLPGVIAGKLAAMYLMALAELSIFAALALAAFAGAGNSPIMPVLLICLLAVLLAQGLGMVLLFVTGNRQVFQAWSDGLILTLAVLGGGLTPAVYLPPFFERLSWLTPQRALTESFVALTYHSPAAAWLPWLIGGVGLALFALGYGLNLRRWGGGGHG